MSGPVALVGAGAFLPAMTDFGRALLAATGRRRPRVAVLPTAAWSSSPAGEDAFQRASAMAVEHFRALGAEVEAVDVRDRASADDPAHAQATGEADLIYLCDGGRGRSCEVLAGSATWLAAQDAHARGAVLVGCGAGATALGRRQLDMGLRLGLPMRWRQALDAAAAVVLPAYDAGPEPLMAVLAFVAPRGLPLVGIDGDAAVIGRSGSWEVHGAGRVTVWRGRHRERHRRGEAFRLDGPAADARMPAGDEP